MGTSHTTATTEAARSATSSHDQSRAETSAPEGSTHAQSFVMRATSGGAPIDSPSRHGSIIARSHGAPQVQAGMINRLQKSHGNGYVARMLQRKLTVNDPGDEYEREADRVADHVARKSRSGKSGCSECAGGAPCEKCRAKAMRAHNGGSSTQEANDVEPQLDALFTGKIGAPKGEMWKLFADKGVGELAGIQLLQDMFKGGGSLTVSRDWVMSDPIFGEVFESMFDGEIKSIAEATTKKAAKGTKSGQGTFSKTEHTTAGPEDCILPGPWCSGPDQSWESSGADITIEGEYSWTIPTDGIFIDLRFFNIKAKFRESYTWRDRNYVEDGVEREEQTPFVITGEWDEDDVEYQHPLTNGNLPDSMRAPAAPDTHPDAPYGGRGASRAMRSALSHHDTTVQRSASGVVQAEGNRGGVVSATTEKKVEALRGKGVPLPKDVRERMEEGFGQDFGAVRVHTGGAAAETARELSAHAYTIGNDVVFGDGKFNPNSAEGEHLLAHELTHVVQQGGSVARSIQREGDGEPNQCVDPGTSSDPIMSSGGLPPEAATTAAPPAMVGIPVTVQAPRLPGEEESPTEVVTIPMNAENPTTFNFFAVPAEVLYLTKEDAKARRNPLSKAAAGSAAGATPAATPPAATPPAAGGAASGSTNADAGAACPPGKVAAVPPAAAASSTTASPAGGTPVLDASVGKVFTPDGKALNVVASTPAGVIVSQYTKYAVGAASTSVVNVDRQVILIDAGISEGMNIPSDWGDTLAETMIESLKARIGSRPIAQLLVTHGHTDHISLIPLIAENFEIQSIRLNELQEKHKSMDDVLDKVRKTVDTRRTKLGKQYSKELDLGKGEWIEKNMGKGTSPEVIESAWKKYRDARVRERLAEIVEPRLERIVRGPKGELKIIVEALGRSPTGTVPDAQRNKIGKRVRLRQFTTDDMSVEAAKHKPGEDIDDKTGKSTVDSHATNYIVEMPNGARFMVLPDLRQSNYETIINAFRAEVAALKLNVKLSKQPVIQIWDITHHMQAGWVKGSGKKTLADGGKVGMHVHQLGEITRFLHEFRMGQQANGATADVVVVSVHAEKGKKFDPKGKVNPLNMWILRSMGFEGYLATRGRSVDVFTARTSQKRMVTGISGDPYAGLAPSELLIARADAALEALERAGLDKTAFETLEADLTAASKELKKAEKQLNADKTSGEAKLAKLESYKTHKRSDLRKKASTLPTETDNHNKLIESHNKAIQEIKKRIADLTAKKNAADTAREHFGKINDAKLRYIEGVEAEIGRSHRDDATKNRPWEAPDPAAPDAGIKEPGSGHAAELRKVLDAAGFDKPLVGGAKPHFDAVALVLIRKEQNASDADPGTPEARANELKIARDKIDRLLLDWKENGGTVETRMELIAEFSRYEFLLDEHRKAGGVDGPSLDVLTDELKTTKENLEKLVPKEGTKTSFARDPKTGQLVRTDVIPLGGGKGGKGGGGSGGGPAGGGVPEGVPESGGAPKEQAAPAEQAAPKNQAAPEKPASEPMPDLQRPGGAVVDTSQDAGGAAPAPKPSTAMKVATGINTASGHFFGALMVKHSFEGLSDLADKGAHGEASGFEMATGTAHHALGLGLGIQMARGVHVGPASFVVLSVLDISYTLAHNYESSDQRDAALINAGIRNGVNIGLMIAGGALMKIPHPAAILAGLALMTLGPIVLEASGLSQFIEAAAGFNPRQVTSAFQDVATQIDEYEAVIGAMELAARSDADLEKLGAKDPTDIRKKSLKTIDKHQVKALLHEKSIDNAFRDAYERARTSYAGLQELDHLRDRYLRLRARAYDKKDEASWEEQEKTLLKGMSMSLDSMSVEEIRDMEQWSKLDKKIRELRNDAMEFNPMHIDWKSVAENDREAGLMVDNARYRLNPGAYGGGRTAPMLAPGSSGRAAYEEELAKRERRLADVRAVIANRAVRMTVSESAGIGGYETLAAPEPGAENLPEPEELEAESFSLGVLLKRLDFGVRAYRTILSSGNLPPGMTPEGVHANAAMNAAYIDYINDNDGYRMWLLRLKASETALTGQADLAAKMFGNGGAASLDEETEYQRLIDEVKALLQERRVVREILFPEEARSRGGAIIARTAHDEAQELGQGAQKELSPSEEHALKTDKLEDDAKHLATMEDQLMKAEQERVREKTTDLVGASLLIGNLERVGIYGKGVLTMTDNALVIPVGFGPDRYDSDYDEQGRPIFDKNHRPQNARLVKSIKVIPVNQVAIDIFGGTAARHVLASMLRPVVKAGAQADAQPHP